MGMLHKRSLMYKERKDLVSEGCITIPKVLVFFLFLNSLSHSFFQHLLCTSFVSGTLLSH